jgi:hypothetical protein
MNGLSSWRSWAVHTAFLEFQGTPCGMEPMTQRLSEIICPRPESVGTTRKALVTNSVGGRSDRPGIASVGCAPAERKRIALLTLKKTSGWFPVTRGGKGEGHRCYSGRARGSVLGSRTSGSGTDGRHTRRIITFFQREKMCARVVLKPREGEGLACVGPEVSDCLDCCRISGQYWYSNSAEFSSS